MWENRKEQRRYKPCEPKNIIRFYYVAIVITRLNQAIATKNTFDNINEDPHSTINVRIADAFFLYYVLRRLNLLLLKFYKLKITTLLGYIIILRYLYLYLTLFSLEIPG